MRKIYIIHYKDLGNLIDGGMLDESVTEIRRIDCESESDSLSD